MGRQPLFLAPMEDVTYHTFRHMCKKYGADVMCTEFVSSEALIRDIRKTKQKLLIFDADRPVAVQIYGHNIDSMVQAAKLAEEIEPDFIDINFGCPVKKIVKRGAGAAFLSNLPLMQEMASRIVKAVNIPVTAKTRLGIDEKNKPYHEIVLRLQDAGISAVAVHGRTLAQQYSGKADWTAIGELKSNQAIRIPIIGNGDITGPEMAKLFLETTHVDGLMIGRAAIGRPWIFREIRHYLDTGEKLNPPALAEIVLSIREQLQMNLTWKENELSVILMMRRHIARYFQGVDDFRELRIKLLQATTIIDLNQVLEYIVDNYGSTIIEYSKADLN